MCGFSIMYMLGSRTGEDEPIIADSPKRESKTLLKLSAENIQGKLTLPPLGGDGVRF